MAISNISPRVVCLECEGNGEMLNILTKAHMELKHGIDKEEYIRRHPEHGDMSFWGTCPYITSAIKAHEQTVIRATGKGRKRRNQKPKQKD